MKLIKQSEIEEAVENNAPIFPVGNEECIAANSFKSGVEFAESKLEDILKEYTKYLGIETDGSLIEQFITKRNGT